MKVTSNMLVGLDQLKLDLDKICQSNQLYLKYGICPPHFILSLDKGNGQSIIAQYISNEFQTHKIRNFGGLDFLLEYRFDGTLSQLKQVFADINSNAVYTNHYEGVISLDISELLFYINESQIEYFISEIEILGSFSTIIMYLPTCSSQNKSILVEKIKQVLNHLITIDIEPYSLIDLIYIIRANSNSNGIEIDDDQETTKLLMDLLSDKKIILAKEAVDLSFQLISHADFNQNPPRIDKNSLIEIMMIAVK
jgi:hypothetical protein